MEYQRCGHSGVLLPKISLGFWHNFGQNKPYELSREIALYAFSQGVVHFDLANNYGPDPGEAERRLGRMLREDLGGHRDELFIATKAAYDMWEGPYGSWASRKHLMASLDQSLGRMGLDYVDLFYCHRYDPDTPLDETLQALVDIVRQGKALYIGISRWPLEALKYAISYLEAHHTPMLICQHKLNILDRQPLEKGILNLLDKEKKGFIAFSPLAQGLLTDRYLNGIPEGSRMTEGRFLKPEALTPVLMERLKKLNGLAQERGETLANMALRWVLQQQATTSVIVGASSVEQLANNLNTLKGTPLSDEEMRIIG